MKKSSKTFTSATKRSTAKTVVRSKSSNKTATLDVKRILPKKKVVSETSEGAIQSDVPIPESGLPFYVVGIGASAGGIEAMLQFFEGVRSDFGMAFVVVQHLDPSHDSQLADVLANKCALPVEEIRDGSELQPNRVYVIPAKSNLVLAKGKLHLSRRKPGEISAMSIDRFMRSLAQEQQHRAIGVLLSGNGSDGTLGLKAIKGAGGVTFAQDESTAKYFSMPGSAIGAGSVDFVLSPEMIARELEQIAHHPAAVRSSGGKSKQSKTAEKETVWDKLLRESPEKLATVFGLLRARTGVDFSHYKHTTLKRRIIRRMILHKLETLPTYVDFLETNPSEVDALFNDLLINVTEFFRDPQVFQILQKKIFPKLIKAHPNDSPLRLWVCGCSTGEEAYSLAMSLVEFFERTRTHRPVQIFGTDISEMGIEKARAGVYPESIVQDVSPERLRRFFTKVNGHYQVHKSIRDMCVFARQNVIVDPPFSNLDLITCRNVLIYLGPVLQRKIIPIFHYALRPTGFLLLGSSETIGSSVDYFTLVNKKAKIYNKKVTFQRPAFDLPNKAVLGEIKEIPITVEATTTVEPKLPELHQHVDRLLLRDFSPAAVVINAQLEVLHFRGRTGPYLEHAPGAASLNLLKMAREGLVIDLRTAIAKSIKQDASVQHRGIQLRLSDRTAEITIEVNPFRLSAAGERLYLVVFKETGGREDGALQVEAGSSAKASRDRKALEQLRSELNATKESLQAIIEEQEATNEELKSANEEIQSSNEELQSTNEELETAKEELQSTNEELTTLNEELQNRNGELTTLNNDLTNLLNNVNVAILMLGNDLTIRRFTPMAERIFNLIPSDVGRRLSDMNRSVLVPDLDESIRDVIDNLSTVEREVQDREGRWFSLRIRPYRTRENKIDGAVIMLVDIDELKRALEGVLSIVKQPLITLGPDLRVKRANDCFLRTFELRRDEVENVLIYEIAGGAWNIPKLQTLLEAILPENRFVDDFEIEMDRKNHGAQRLRVSARRFYENTRGMQMILLAVELP